MVGALEEQELKEQELAAPEAQRPHKKRRRRSREKRRVETAPPESPELEVRSVSAEPEAQKTDNVLRSEPVDHFTRQRLRSSSWHYQILGKND